MTSETLVTYELAESIAIISLDDGKVNVMSAEMQRQIHAALDRAEADEAVVIITGRARVLSAGFDLGILARGGIEAAEMCDGGFKLAARILAFPYPTVIACPGHAIAMGAFLLLSADYRIGVEGTFKFVANEVALGITVPMAATEILRQRLTPAAFNRAAILSEEFSPVNAVEAGFLDRVVPPDDLLATARAMATTFSQLNMKAHAATKQRARAATLTAINAGIAVDSAELISLLAG